MCREAKIHDKPIKALPKVKGKNFLTSEKEINSKVKLDCTEITSSQSSLSFVVVSGGKMAYIP